MIGIEERLRNYWPILAYHSISDSRTDGLAISAREFESHIRYFHERNYRSTGVDELHDSLRQRGDTHQKTFVITFDDGYADNFHLALPILRKYGYTATFYVVTDSLDSNELHWFDAHKPAQGMGLPEAFRVMTWDNVRELASQGMTIGSHTCSHAVFDGSITTDRLHHEIQHSKDILEERIGQPITSFCYPRGKLDRRAIPLIADAGYATAVVTPSVRDDIAETRFTLKRVGIYRSSYLKFRAKLTPAFFYLRTKGIVRR